jgi:KaiC/GvpD/RAD55 family RecA-like ATPase/class 3 adenylate cyclase
MSEDRPRMPGQGLIFNGSGSIPPSIMLLIGPSGSGKTIYSVQFLREGLANNCNCIFINCNQGFTKEKLNSYFEREGNASRVPLYFNPFDAMQAENRASLDNQANNKGGPAISAPLASCLDFISLNGRVGNGSPLCIVVDSLTNLVAKYSVEEIGRFVVRLYDLLKVRGNATGMLTLTGSPANSVADAFGSLVDGIVQLRIEDSGDDIRRDIRILSLKGIHNVPKWTRFFIAQDGEPHFGDNETTSEEKITCKLCDRAIVGEVSRESGASFHPHCLDTYRKLDDIYGSHPVYALEPGVVNANFFFIDIVGLSDPLLSVEKQIRKIEELNMLIGACDAFAKVSNDSKIVLPTGDGMVIGFLVNPELPLQLSMQLHRRLLSFNARQSPDRSIGVRIGLSSGPVFVVSDINNNQNVWGPGIILARRVMDLGDNGHILLADNIAETLMNLKDEYKAIIKPLSPEYKIKHGQLLRLYSAYSDDFGNSSKPTRITELV